ncbi:conserved hypothetical protein [Pediculus humanus corporis]|uniref:SH2 domain-containing adapter protein D n=1 Tax=Pediculus humanus subsp. corporis TaxID=121224 RepID=E0VSD3_PEDHC|nr:uncharacterized protein Phum_PHUM417170 [Pediculus humanus corporis]EEB16289.1 conserved hypothetical protein [Pediculus humanus corporis]
MNLFFYVKSKNASYRISREFGTNALRSSTGYDGQNDEPIQHVERRPSPYYYSDILNQDDLEPSAFKSYRKPETAKNSTVEPFYSQSSKQLAKERKQLESYHPFSAKENFEPKQGGLDFYDFASGRVRKKHKVVEVNEKKKLSRRTDEKKEENKFDEEKILIERVKDERSGNDDEYNSKRQGYVKSISLDVPSSIKKKTVQQKKECRKSASLDIPFVSNVSIDEVGENSNKFRPIVPVRETEEGGIEGGDEEEEDEIRSRKKSFKKLPQYNHCYRDCLTGAPKKTFPCGDKFSPADVLQHVIHGGIDNKSLLAACLAEWDAHARLMRPLTARALTQCACAIGAQKQCASSDEEEEEDYHYTKSPLSINFPPRKNTSLDSIRKRDFFKEPIPDGKNLGDEFVKGQKVKSEIDDGNISPLNPREIFRNWGIIVNEKGGFESWNDGYDDNSDSAEAYKIAREILEETENWDLEKKNILLKPECRSTESLYDFENMSRRGLLYETAFDCKVSRSDDDLEELDRVTNHPILHSRIGRSKSAVTAPLIESYTRPPRPGSSFSKNPLKPFTKEKKSRISSSDAENASEDISNISDRVKNITLVQTPTPPSTAPLPSKFCGHEDFTMNSIKSAPELSSKNNRIKDSKLPVKSLRGRNSRPSSLLTSFNDPLINSDEKRDDASEESLCQNYQNSNDNNINNNNNKSQKLAQKTELILEFKGRPEGESTNKKPRAARPRSLIGEIRPTVVLGQRKNGRLKFSSTESVATSSSGGSLESIKSSTSEGNRSTTSSESHRSSSLSSHSSDSMSNVVAITTANLQYHLKQTNPHDTNKMQNALSPISDKSSVEPSETSDNNKNNNSQKPSPEESHDNGTNESQHHSHHPHHQHHNHPPMSSSSSPLPPPPPKLDFKVKRKTLQNKNLINLGLQMSSSSNEAAQGSDSGISVESRTLKSSGIFSNQTETDFSDLPFDMPKLRRRRLVEQENVLNRRLLEVDACTSSSATSVDLRDLPFDMPKLRRRLRPGGNTGESQASSSQSVAEQTGNVLFRPSMTLSLDLESNSIQNQTRGLSLDLERGRGCGTMTLNAFSGVDLIDPSLPLEKQTWYHGSITRVEAEDLLRSLKEGSYLVRNSESAKQDYSLSLKSAKGFMHMRIQIDNNSGQFILGQFSKPFNSIPDMIRHYSVNKLPIRGAEHMCLLKPVAAQLL